MADRQGRPGADGPEPDRLRSGVLHGRQQGRRLRAGQAALLEDLLPTYALTGTGRLETASLFGSAVTALRLEVGFGGGEHLIAEAQAHPTIGFIGCEPFRNGVVSLLQRLALQPLPNLRLHVGDGGAVVDRLPDAALSGCDLLYPDPWPKRRQRKRRFVSTTMLQRLARVMQHGAAFRFATDIDDYAGWTLARIAASADFTWTATTADDWRRPWPGWTSTRYEAKARQAGRPPVYLTFTRR